jgi:hypothetical protein
MSTFKIKDLMINLGATETDLKDLNPTFQLAPIVTEIFRCRPTFFTCPVLTCHHPTYVPITLTRTIYQQTLMETPQDIATLRAQLKQQLALLDQQEKEQEAQLKPQTLEEAEQLEHKMKEALVEVQKIKESFKKK